MCNGNAIYLDEFAKIPVSLQQECIKTGFNGSKVGGKLNREIVSVRSCVRTRGLVVRWELEKIELPPGAFPFSLLAQDGISFEFCVVLVNPGEI